MKFALSKSPVRRQLFQAIVETQFPPVVIEIRRHTWLKACFFSGEHFSKVNHFIKALEEDTVRVKNLQSLLGNDLLEKQLFDINGSKFECTKIP